MAESVTPIYGFPQWQDGDHGWGDSVNRAFVVIESLINSLSAIAKAVESVIFVGGNSGGGYTGTTTITQPGGVQANDVGVLVIAGTNPAAPGGWTSVDGVTGVYYKVYGSSEGSVVITGTPSAGRLTGALAVYRNVDTTTPFDTAMSQSTITSGTHFTGTSITSGYDGSMCLSILSPGYFATGTTEVLSPPTNFTAAASQATDSIMIAIAHKNNVNKGVSTGPVGWSGTQATTYAVAATLLLRGANQLLPVSGWSFDDLSPALQEMLVVIQGFASWGELAGVKTWQQIYDQNITWGQAANLTWGELCGLTTWQRVFDLYTSWGDASSRNWGAL